MARAPRVTSSGERVTVRSAYDRKFRKAQRACKQPDTIPEGMRPIPSDFRRDDTQ